MLLEMFFNELSSAPFASDAAAGQDRAKQFVTTMIAATTLGVRRVLRIPKDFFSSPLAPDYNWYQWLADERVEREIRQYFRSLASRAPFLHDMPSIETEWIEIDCLWQKQKTLGLKAAYVTDGLAFSLLSRKEWNTHYVECEIQEVVEEDVDCRNETIHHASRGEHVTGQREWILKRVQNEVSDASEFWRYINQSFPLLSFCATVEKQVVNLPVLSFASIIRGLFHLNAYCADWQSGAFEPDRIGCNISPESQSTLQQYGNQREFNCPDGQKRIFSWHVKIGKWRIHFDPAPGPGHLIIGYIGKHLDTSKFH